MPHIKWYVQRETAWKRVHESKWRTKARETKETKRKKKKRDGAKLQQ